jgi:hypothetical protein
MKVRLRSILIAILLILSGGVLTLMIERFVVRHNTGATPARLHLSLIAEMDSTLGLTPAQHDSIHAIFVRHQSQMDTAWRSINERMHTTMDSVHHEVFRVLKPAQIAAFHEWMRRQRGEHDARHQRPLH